MILVLKKYNHFNFGPLIFGFILILLLVNFNIFYFNLCCQVIKIIYDIAMKLTIK